MTQDHRQALDVAKDGWNNPVLMSYIKFRYLPFNISSKEATKVRNRAKHYASAWTHCVEKGEQLRYIHKGQPDRVYPNPGRRPALLFQALSEGHLQVQGVTKRLNSRFFWYRMREDIVQHVRQCEVCHSTSTLVTADREMKAIEPLEKGQRWHVDLVGPLYPSNEQDRYIAVAIDSRTKWPEAAPLKHKVPGEVEAFVFRDIVCRFPVTEIVTDNGSEFEGDFSKMCQDLGLTHRHTSVYRPQANGAVERFNAFLKEGLHRLSYDHPASWPYLIQRVLRQARTNVHSTTGMPPVQYLMGAELPLLGFEAMAWQPYVLPTTKEDGIPQGPEWYGKRICKIFPEPKTQQLRLYEGTGVGLSVTADGMERYQVHYPQDNDREEEEVATYCLGW